MKIVLFLPLLFPTFILTGLADANSQQQNKGPENFPQRTLAVTQTQSNLSRNNNNQNQSEKRKLVDPPAGEMGQSFSPAQSIGGFGGGGMQSQGGFQQPNMNSMMAGNMMMGNAMIHPMINPFSPANPFSPISPANPFSPMSPMNSFNQFNEVADGQRSRGGHFVSVDDDGLSDGGDGLEGAADIGRDVFDDASGLRVLNKCHSVKSQAIEIANRIMRKQNNKIFKELLAYLIKGKFLIGMTEIKLTRALRKRVFGLMTAFSTLQHDQINFIDPEPEAEDYELEEAPAKSTPFSKFVSSLRKYDTSFADTVYPSIDDNDKRDVDEEAADMNNNKKLSKA